MVGAALLLLSHFEQWIGLSLRLEGSSARNINCQHPDFQYE